MKWVISDMNKKKRKLKRLATKAFKYGYVADNFDTYISMQQGTDIEMERMKKSLAGMSKSLHQLRTKVTMLENDNTKKQWRL